MAVWKSFWDWCITPLMVSSLAPGEVVQFIAVVASRIAAS